MATSIESDSRAFPAEIFDHILDYLRDHKRVFSSCALVCKSFLPRSRYHIFAAITLNRCNYTRFLELLRGAPYLAAYVRTLRLQRSRAVQGAFVSEILSEEGVSPVLQEMFWIFLTIQALPVPLAAVTRLDMEAMTFTKEFVHNLGVNLRNVDDLRLFQCSFDTVPRFFSLHTSLRRLNKITLSDVFIKPSCGVLRLPYNISVYKSSVSAYRDSSVNANDDDSPTVNASKIQSLRFTSRVAYDVFAPQTIKWLAQGASPSALTRLEIATLRDTDIPALEEMLRTAGSSLRDLAVGFATETSTRWEGKRTPLDLKDCTSLEVLTIQALKLRCPQTAHGFASPTRFPSAWVLDMLGTLKSRVLHTLSLRFRSAHMHMRENDHTTDWSRLGDTILALASLGSSPRTGNDSGQQHNAGPGLRLHLYFCARDTLTRDAYPVIRRGLSALHSDGRVDVRYMFQDPYNVLSGGSSR